MGNDVFAEIEAREQGLFQLLGACPVVDVTGVVSARGAGGGKSRGEELWTLHFEFDAWRIDGAEVQTQALTIRRKVTDEQLRSFQETIRPHRILRIRVHVGPEVSADETRKALLESIIELDAPDAELRDHAKRMQETVTHEDGVFGALTLDRSVGWYTAKTAWKGNLVKLNCPVEKPEDLADALRTAHALWRDQDRWKQQIGDFAVEELLPLKNDNWLDENEAEVTADQFRSRMMLDAVTVYPDGSFEFWHNDGDLFWGHAILIDGNLSEGPTGADIPG
jgi:hypothetical protein